MDTQKTGRGWRGTPDLWLEAAYALLVEGGVEAVKVMPLAERLGLSRTSFYWHFADREALLAALVDRWKARNTGTLVARCEAPAATITEAMLNLVDCWVDAQLFDSRLEFAVRSWALQDPAMMARLNDEDERRLAALIAMFHRWGHAALDAETRARAVYLTQIGYIAMQQREDLAIRMARIPAYVQIFTGTAPEARELARFHVRYV